MRPVSAQRSAHWAQGRDRGEAGEVCVCHLYVLTKKQGQTLHCSAAPPRSKSPRGHSQPRLGCDPAQEGLWVIGTCTRPDCGPECSSLWRTTLKEWRRGRGRTWGVPCVSRASAASTARLRVSAGGGWGAGAGESSAHSTAGRTPKPEVEIIVQNLGTGALGSAAGLAPAFWNLVLWG